MPIHELLQNMQKGKQTDLILLDFSKAFDKVSLEKLINKLHNYGVKGNTLSWIKSFLNNRTQTVVNDGKQSRTAPVTSGVPQGSVLGPILFMAYINDLPDNITSQVRLFADDTVVYAAISTMDEQVSGPPNHQSEEANTDQILPAKPRTGNHHRRKPRYLSPSSTRE